MSITDLLDVSVGCNRMIIGKDALGGSLADGFESFSFALDGLWIRVVHLVRMVEGAVAVTGLVDVII